MTTILRPGQHCMPAAEVETASGNTYLEYAASPDNETPIDMHDVIRTGNIPEGVSNKTDVAKKLLEVNASWLPFAAEKLGISSSLKDLIIVPTTIFLTDIPNSNLAAFTFDELSSWNTQAGDLTYATWKRRPCHIEHRNDDPTKAAGIILDASLRHVANYVGNLYREVLLTAWDRYRYPETAKTILAGRSGFSMGAWVNDYVTGCCGASFRAGGCAHIGPNRGPTVASVGNRLVYRIAQGVQGFEVSQVAKPAFRTAMGQPIEPDWQPSRPAFVTMG